MEPELVVHSEAMRSIPLHERMGLAVLQRGPEAKLTMELGDDVRGLTDGSIHGGILATFADITCATALWGSYDNEVERPATTDMHVRYYRQPQGGPLTAEGHLVHRGRHLLSSECTIVDSQNRVLARATATYTIVPMPSDDSGSP
jgi:uncharacterized protein (TIGR00369 family)